MLTMVALPGRRAFRFLATLPMIASPFMIALAAVMQLLIGVLAAVINGC